MKKKIHEYGLFVVLIVLLFSCKKNTNEINHETAVSPAELIAPLNSTAINLGPDDTAPVVFSWKSVKVENGTLAFYKVLFDKEDGDFSEPLMVKESGKSGTELNLSLSRADLDSLTNLAGAEPNSPVKLKWTVLAGNGISSSITTAPFTFTLTVANASDAVQLMAAADRLMDSVVRYFLKGMPLDIWGEVYPRKNTYWDGASTVWGQGAAFSGYAALKYMARNNETLKQKYITGYDSRLLTSIDKFRNTRSGGPEAYAVFPGSGDERYYDDNVWIGIDMVDLYLLTKDQKYLDRAKIVWNFVLSGTDDVMGGGVYWKEGNRNGKNTCSTAPGAILGLKLYEATGQQSYLDQGKAYYNWVKSKLQDPTDHIYWDNAKLSDPANPNSPISIDKNKFTYNSGTPMQAAVLLYHITGETHYLDEAKEIAAAAYHRWFKPYYSNVLNEEIRIWNDNNLWFNSVLLRGYIELYKVDKNSTYVNAYKKIMSHAWLSEAHDETTGLLDTDFKGNGSQAEWKILYQGACVEMLARLADLEVNQ